MPGCAHQVFTAENNREMYHPVCVIGKMFEQEP